MKTFMYCIDLLPSMSSNEAKTSAESLTRLSMHDNCRAALCLVNGRHNIYRSAHAQGLW